MKKQRIEFCIILISFFSTLLSAQTDSLVLQANQLGFQDILTNENLFDNQKVVSASRSLKEISDLPFTILIITKEEILENGYTTLVDVLKMAPGIRTSQPGSASDGETFLMRGLKGNTYTKILINGAPVKPSSIVSMPIGAQLPIRQADRIEIIYGPAAALYGADANAGVINIIIEKTNKPLYTQATLARGGNNYTNVDVMFGGKLGKNKKVLNFNFYGSATSYENRNIIYDYSRLYDHTNYVPDDEVRANPNYPGPTPMVLSLPHESKLIGVDLKYKIFSIKSQFMSRKDHSAIGLNPAAVSYNNPSNFIGDQIITSEFTVAKQFKHWSFRTNIGAIQYDLDDNSSTDYIENTLKRAVGLVNTNLATNPLDSSVNQVLLDSLSTASFETYFSGNRYSFAQSFENYIDQSFSFYPFENFEISIGGQFKSMVINPRVDYYKTPRNTFGNDISQNPFKNPRITQQEITAYAQSYLTLNKFNFIGGVQFYRNAEYGRFVNPRLSMVYKLNKGLGIRAFYGKSYRAPSPFYAKNSYFISGEAEDLITQIDVPLNPERTTSYEIGTRWSPSKSISADVVFYRTITENFISPNFILGVSPFDVSGNFLGYANFENSQSILRGIQSSFVFKNVLQRFFPKHKLNIKLNATYAEGSEIIPTTDFELKQIREVPKWIFKTRLFYKPFKRWSFTTDHILMSGISIPTSINQEFVYPSNFKGFYTIDVLIRCELTRNFKIYIKINNFLDANYAGLNATNTPDDLIYNPQELSALRVGMNYQMN